MKHAAMVSLLFALGACATTGPEREAQIVKTAIDAGRLACVTAAAKRVELTEAQRAWCEGKAP